MIAERYRKPTACYPQVKTCTVDNFTTLRGQSVHCSPGLLHRLSTSCTQVYKNRTLLTFRNSEHLRERWTWDGCGCITHQDIHLYPSRHVPVPAGPPGRLPAPICPSRTFTGHSWTFTCPSRPSGPLPALADVYLPGRTFTVHRTQLSAPGAEAH